MMSRGGALAGALAAALFLAGCVGGERVTLLSPVQDRGVGAVAVLEDDGSETVLDQANSQAKLSASGPRVRQLREVDPAYSELISSLPRRIEPQVITFPTAVTKVSPEAIARLRATVESLGSDRSIYQIEIAGYTDSVGSEDDNLRLSQGRADKVAELLRAEGFDIEPSDVIGRGEYDAVRTIGDDKESERFRSVVIVIR